MSLQDEHLQTALRHAPDQDLAPSQQVRDQVLNYAVVSVKSAPKSWLKRALIAFANWRVKTWQVASMGALASMLLVIVMVREQAPQEPVWMDAQMRDLAQNKTEALKTAPASANAPALNQQATQPEASTEDALTQNTLAKDAIGNERGVAANMAREAPKSKQAAQAKDDLPAEIVPSTQLAKPTEMAAASTSADKAEAKGIDAPAQTADVAAAPALPAESHENQGFAKNSPAEAKASTLRNAANINVQLVQKLVSQGGEAVAKADIAANQLRILKLVTEKCDSIDSVEAHDADTHYKVLLICDLADKSQSDILQNQVRAYNQAMRDWYEAHK